MPTIYPWGYSTKPVRSIANALPMVAQALRPRSLLSQVDPGLVLDVLALPPSQLHRSWSGT